MGMSVAEFIEFLKTLPAGAEILYVDFSHVDHPSELRATVNDDGTLYIE